MFPELHLIESDVKTIFVSTGFPQNRHRFLRKYFECNDDDEKEDGEGENSQSNPKPDLITIPGSDQQYFEPLSVHEKYSYRPDSLEHLCLAQFAIWYVLIPKKSKVPKIEDGGSDEKIICPEMSNPQSLPKYIELNDKNKSKMRLRCFPAVLRMHRFKEENDAHEFFFSELLLYRHWRSEEELFPHDFESCLQLFQRKVENTETLVINWVKDNLFPEMNNVELARAVLEEFSDSRPSHIPIGMTRETSIMFFKNYVTNGQQCFRRRMSLRSRLFYKARDVIVISTV